MVDITNSKQLLEFQMDELETLNRLEPNITPRAGESVALLSIAISFKRVADTIDRRTPGQRVEQAHTSMVIELCKRNNFAKGLNFSEVMKLVGDYFFKLTGIRSGESE